LAKVNRKKDGKAVEEFWVRTFDLVCDDLGIDYDDVRIRRRGTLLVVFGVRLEKKTNSRKKKHYSGTRHLGGCLATFDVYLHFSTKKGRKPKNSFRAHKKNPRRYVCAFV